MSANCPQGGVQPAAMRRWRGMSRNARAQGGIAETRRLRLQLGTRRGQIGRAGQNLIPGGIEAQPVAVDVGRFQEGGGFGHGSTGLVCGAPGVVEQRQLDQHVGIVEAGRLPPPVHGWLQDSQGGSRISAQGLIFRRRAGPGEVGTPGLQVVGLQAVREARRPRRAGPRPTARGPGRRGARCHSRNRPAGRPGH